MEDQDHLSSTSGSAWREIRMALYVPGVPPLYNSLFLVTFPARSGSLTVRRKLLVEKNLERVGIVAIMNLLALSGSGIVKLARFWTQLPSIWRLKRQHLL